MLSQASAKMQDEAFATMSKAFYEQNPYSSDDPTSSLKRQVGGTHYKDFAIQPIEFIHANGIGFAAGNVIKYVCRYTAKDGLRDLEKAKHYIELLIDMEASANERS